MQKEVVVRCSVHCSDAGTQWASGLSAGGLASDDRTSKSPFMSLKMERPCRLYWAGSVSRVFVDLSYHAWIDRRHVFAYELLTVFVHHAAFVPFVKVREYTSMAGRMKC